MTASSVLRNSFANVFLSLPAYSISLSVSCFAASYADASSFSLVSQTFGFVVLSGVLSVSDGVSEPSSFPAGSVCIVPGFGLLPSIAP